MNKNFLGLKILVAVMGVMIIVGVGIVAYTIISRMNAGEPIAGAAREPVRKWPSPKAFGDVDVKLPAGAVVEEMESGLRRLTVRIRTADGEQHILVFDLADGRKLGTIRLAP